MPFVIAEPCIGVKDKSCVEVCPVNCIYEGEDQYYIHPDECIDCQACEAACPVQAIFPDNGAPDKWQTFIEKNRLHFENQCSRTVRDGDGEGGAGAPPRSFYRGGAVTTETLPTREQALALLQEWVQNVNLRKHCYAVEAAMRAYARKLGGDEARWGLAGLIHDFDWE